MVPIELSDLLTFVGVDFPFLTGIVQCLVHCTVEIQAFSHQTVYPSLHDLSGSLKTRENKFSLQKEWCFYKFLVSELISSNQDKDLFAVVK